MSPALKLRVTRQIFGKQRAGTYQAHVASDNVPKLWQLIQAGAAEKSSDSGETAFVGLKFALNVPSREHCSELIHRETSPAETDAVVPEQNMSTHGNSDGTGNEHHERGQTN